MKFKYLILFVTGAFLAGCQQGEEGHPLVEPDDVVLVEVDGEPVTLPMLEHLMRVRGVDEEDTEGMRQLLDELIRLQAIANRAESEGISTGPEVRAERMIKDVETQYVRFLEAWQLENPVTNAEIEAAYNEQAGRAGDQRFQLETIEFADQAPALEQLDALTAGDMTFDEALLAADSSGRTARRTGWIDGTQVPPDFRALLATSAEGEVVETLLPFQDSWLVVRVAGKQEFQPPSLDEVRDGIRRTLLRERTQEMIDRTYEAAEITPMLPLDDASGGSPEGP